MVRLGLEPRAAGWKAQTNPLSYGGTPFPRLFQLCFDTRDAHLQNTGQIPSKKILCMLLNSLSMETPKFANPQNLWM